MMVNFISKLMAKCRRSLLKRPKTEIGTAGKDMEPVVERTIDGECFELNGSWHEFYTTLSNI